MSRELIERAAFTTALNTYLTSKGWTGITYREGFPDEQVLVGTIAVHFMPTNKSTLQLGDTDEKLFKRVVQTDAYMENEARASAIMDDIMDFIELTPIVITDIVQNTVVGSLTCQDNDSIYGELFAPNYLEVKVKRWRSVVRATLEAHYP